MAAKNACTEAWPNQNCLSESSVLTLQAPELHSYGNRFHSTRLQSLFFTILPILHKTLVAVTKVFHGCTDQHFTLSGVTFHAKHANLNCLKNTIFLGRLQQYMLHFGQSGCGTSMCVYGSDMCASLDLDLDLAAA